jgi:hypothetical protein
MPAVLLDLGVWAAEVTVQSLAMLLLVRRILAVAVADLKEVALL